MHRPVFAAAVAVAAGTQAFGDGGEGVLSLLQLKVERGASSVPGAHCRSQGPAKCVAADPATGSSSQCMPGAFEDLRPSPAAVGVLASCKAHRFRFPAPNEDRVLCVPQKNGNRNFGALVHMMTQGRVPSSIEDVVDQMHTYSTRAVSPCDRVWLVARNPYTRILSLYLQKVAGACVSGGFGCRTDYDDDALGRNVTSFEDFVSTVAERAREDPHGLCGIDHHLCSQVSGCLFAGAADVAVLKLERQATWFPCLVDTLGVSQQDLVGAQWQNVSGQPCFYAPTGDCSAALAPSAEGAQTVPVVDHVHGTGADAAVLEHYTRTAAQVVTDLYREDLEALGYPEWDGSQPFVSH